MYAQRNHKHRLILLLLVCLAALSGVGARLAVSVGRVSVLVVEASDYPTIRTYVVVEDSHGNPLTGLDASNFALYEEGVQVEGLTVEPVEQPMLLGVVIDSAISFETREGGARRVEHAKSATIELIAPESGRLQLHDQVAIFAFEEGVPFQLLDFTYDHNLAIDQGVAAVDTTGNQYTALFDIAEQAIDAMARVPGTMRRVLLIFSDGQDYVSTTEFHRLVQRAQEDHLVIFTIGMGTNLDVDQEYSVHLRLLADDTGGRYMWYRPGRRGEDEELAAFLDHLVAHRSLYILSYQTEQYEGEPALRVVVQSGGRSAEDSASFTPPPMPPLLKIDNLESGEVIQGTFTVRPVIFRNQRDIARVEYRVDDELEHTALGSPFTFEWDTTRWATSSTTPTAVSLVVTAYDIGKYSAEQRLTVGLILPPPPPTPVPPAPVSVGGTNTPLLVVASTSLVVSLGAVVFLVVTVRRGGWSAVRGWAEEAARRTRVWAKETRRRLMGQPIPVEAALGTLIIESEVMHGKLLQIKESGMFLGREEQQADLVFDWDDFVSRKHAKISLEDGQFYVWDLGSANGTWVNEQRVPRSRSGGTDIAEAVRLNDGSVLRLGPNLRLRFRAGVAAPTPGAVPEEPATHVLAPSGATPTPKPMARPETETTVLPREGDIH